MSGAFVQFKSSFDSGTTSVQVTLTSPVTAGNALIVGAYSGSSGNDTSLAVIDNVNSISYAKDVSRGLTVDGDTIAIFSLFNVAAGTTQLTLSRSGSSGSLRIAAHEYSGLLTSLALDQAVSGYGASGTTATSANATTTYTAQLLFGIVGTASGDQFTAGGAFTVRDTNPTGSTMGSEDQFVAVTGSYASNFGISVSDEWATCLATYKLVGGGGGGGTPLMGQACL